MTKDELEAKGTELTDLDLSPERGGRVDAVSVPAARRKGRTLKFLLRKSADVQHPNGNRSAEHVDRLRDDDEDKPPYNMPDGEFFEKLMASIAELQRDMAELKAANRKNANSLLKAAPPASRQAEGQDDPKGKAPKLGEGLFKTAIFGRKE